MATAEQPRYMWIPPPPLPEFYLPKGKVDKKKKTPSSSSSSGSGTEGDEKVDERKQSVQVTFKKKQSEGNGAKERQPPFAVDGAYDGLPTPYRYVGIPPPPPPCATTSIDVSPLVVYHICRICLRPRSSRYHRKHPIPVNGVPPPPGICRRCRVEPVKDASETSELNISDVDEVVRKGRSNEIKLGLIAPFVPDEAIISSEAAKRMQAQRYLRGRSRERHITIFHEVSSESERGYRRSKSRRDDIVYRHVRVVEEPEPESRTKTVKLPAAEDRPARDANDAQLYVQYERRAEQTGVTNPEAADDPSLKSRPSLKSTNLANVDSTGDSKSSQRPSSSSTSSATQTKKSAGNTMYLKRPGRTESEIRKVAGEEARRYAVDMRKIVRPESELRRIAHEEVERYREAERKLETRPDAFAHGRLVPVPRQIEIKQSEHLKMPWKEARRTTSPAAVDRPEASRKLESVQSVKSTSCGSSTGQIRSERESWGPQWRRELSLERRRSSETRDERWRVDVTKDARSRVYALPSDLPRSDKPRGAYDVVPGSSTSARTSSIQSQVASETQKRSSEPTRAKEPAEELNMGLLFPPPGRYEHRDNFGRERETVERLDARSRNFAAPRNEADPAVSGKSKARETWEETDVRRSATAGSSVRWETSGSGVTSSGTVRSSVKPWERGSEEHAAFLAEKKQPQFGGAMSPAAGRKPADTRQGSDVQYEYKLHTIRPADQPGDMHARKRGSPPRSARPDHVTLEIWQQVPTDLVQRAREARMHEKERNDAVEWLKTRMNDPKAQVGVDPDGSRRLACSIPHRGSDKRRPRSPPAPQGPSPRQSAPPKDRSPRRQVESRPQRSAGSRGGRDDGAADWPDREVVAEVWEQVPAKEAARFRRQAAEDGGRCGGDGKKEYVIEAWKQVPSNRPSASSVRRDSAVEMPPARRRRERREFQRPSDDSARVKFASKVEISPTPPGSDESSNAFRRFHDFMGRKGARQQIDGHDSEERGEDLIAEYERRGRLRSREPARRKSEQVYDGRDARDRDATVRPREGQRRYDGKRDERWHPLQRALSESPSREWSDRKRSSVKSGPPYHPDERPADSMTTHDGSRSGRRWW